MDNLPENLGSVVGLKELKLSGTSIKELPSSIERLTSLTLLTLRDCKNLVCLPNTIWSVKMGDSLDLAGCTIIDKLPKNLGNIEGLEKLDLSGIGIKEFPSSIERLTSLTNLTLRDCKNLVCLPNAVWGLKLVNSLDLAGCTKFENLPENLGNVEGLEKLHLSGTVIKELPSSIEHLTNLTKLTLSNCKNLVCLPNAIWSLKLGNSLDLSGCSKFDNLPENLGNVEGLEKLDLSGTAIKELPSSIEHLTNLTLLTLKDCKNLMHLPNNIWNLKLLKFLDLCGCSKFDNLGENLGNAKGLELLNLSGTAIKEVPSSIHLLKNLKELNVHGCNKWALSLFYSMPSSYVLVDQLLPSLSGLHSLTNLDLSDCDLSSIPNEIGCLSSLAHLNLSGNNFVSLPESISQLSNLQRLHLEGCERLQSLQSVPSTIDVVIPNNCTSLERLPELQNYSFKTAIVPHLEFCKTIGSHLCFQCVNCFKLVDNIQIDDILQGQNGRLRDILDIIIPGGKIPKWFSLECRGDNIEGPFGCNDPMGIALCLVFVRSKLNQHHRGCRLLCLFEVNGFTIECVVSEFWTKYGEVKLPHLWLLYLSSHLFGSSWKEILKTDANGCCKLEIKVISHTLVVKKIGVRLVYEQDKEGPNQTMAPCSNSSIPYEELGVHHHDLDDLASEGSDSALEGTDLASEGSDSASGDSAPEGSRNKRSCDEDDGAGPSGEGYSNEELHAEIWRIYDLF
nr:putative disease resistance protein [Quercus suber]